MPNVIIKNQTYNVSWISNNVENYPVSEFLSFYKLKQSSTEFYFNQSVDANITTLLDTFLLDEDGSYVPPDPSTYLFEGDYLVQGEEIGDYVNKTPNTGTVKLNDVVTSLLLNKDVDFNITTLGASSFSSFSEFPKDITNLPELIGKNPTDNYDDFIGYLHDEQTERWFENTVVGQANYWRVIIDYTKPDNKKDKKVVFTVSNPDTGFSQQVFILADKNEFLNFALTFTFVTISDAISIANGYLFTLVAEDQDLTINNLSVTRSSWGKL